MSIVVPKFLLKLGSKVVALSTSLIGDIYHDKEVIII